jgi:hypothetical protein
VVSPPPSPPHPAIPPLASESPLLEPMETPPALPGGLPWTDIPIVIPPGSPLRQEEAHVSWPLLDYVDWPKDLMGMYKYLTQIPGETNATPRDWGDDWLDCVEEYMSFQGISGFSVSHQVNMDRMM